MQLLNNLPLLPPSLPYNWSANPDPALRAFADTIPIPPYLGCGLLGDQRLDDDTTEKVIRHWIWNTCYWTGRNNPEIPHPDEMKGSKILAWMQANAQLNNGLGPEMSCGTIANLTVSLLAAYGILARKIQATSVEGKADASIEFWSPNKPGWVHVIPQNNAHFQTTSGQPLSYLEWSSHEIETGHREGFTLTGLGGSYGMPKHPVTEWTDNKQWLGYHDSAIAENGNTYHAESNPTGPYALLQVHQGSGKFQNDQLGTIQPKLIQDLYPSGNALHAELKQAPLNCLIQLQTQMPNFYHFQALYDDLYGWIDIPNHFLLTSKPTYCKALSHLASSSQIISLSNDQPIQPC